MYTWGVSAVRCLVLDKNGRGAGWDDERSFLVEGASQVKFEGNLGLVERAKWS